MSLAREEHMPETPPDVSVAQAVQASLHSVARLLREPHPLSAEAQDALAGYIDELTSLLADPQAPPEAVRHLADSTAHLVEAVHHRDEGLITAARDRLEQAILGAGAQVPVAAGVARRVLDALANIGI
jgi:hypothetical protein